MSKSDDGYKQASSEGGGPYTFVIILLHAIFMKWSSWMNFLVFCSFVRTLMLLDLR